MNEAKMNVRLQTQNPAPANTNPGGLVPLIRTAGEILTAGKLQYTTATQGLQFYTTPKTLVSRTKQRGHKIVLVFENNTGREMPRPVYVLETNKGERALTHCTVEMRERRVNEDPSQKSNGRDG